MKKSPAGHYTPLKKLGAAGSMLLGLILLVAGVILSALAFFEKADFDRSEIIMLAASFVFLGLGAHCLDLLDKERKAKTEAGLNLILNDSNIDPRR